MTPKLHLIGNAHIDPVWLWPWTDGFHEVKATFRSALDRMNEDPDFIFTASSAAFYEWVEQSDPEMFAEIRRRVTEGRWELAGGWWVEPDCNIPAGESFTRQGLYAQRYFLEKFKRRARVGYAPDSFGHHGMLPQILKKSGMDYYVFMRPSPHEKTLPGRVFWWQSEDGARVLALRIPFDYSSWGHELVLQVERVAAELTPPVDGLMCFYGVGNHGGGPTRENLASLHRLQQRTDLPELIFSSPERYFAESEARGWALPTVLGDLQHHASGCYSAHSGIKRWNRQAENLLLAAEKWAATAQIAVGQPYPVEDFRRAWKDVLFNQFHDILAGTSLESAYEDARNLFGEALSLGGRALNLACQAFSWRVNIPAGPESRPVIAFNPHTWPNRTNLELEMGAVSGDELLLDPEDHPVPFQLVQSQATAGGRSRLSFVADLPPLGYAVYRLAPAEKPAPFPVGSASDTWLENDRFRLEISPHSGAIASLFDKRYHLEVLDGEGARPVVIDDPSDTWSHNVLRFDHVVGAFEPISIKLAEHGPVKSVIRVTSAYGASSLTQEFTLYPDLDQIEVRVTLDWREHFKMLKLRFPLNLNPMKVFAEIPYGTIERQANGEEEPCQNWVDGSGIARQNGIPYGVSLLNDGKYSYDVNIHEIGLTVLRSPVYANHTPVVPAPGGTYSFIDQGIQYFRYTILPHAGSWETAGTVRAAAALNQPAQVMAATVHGGSLPLRASYLTAQPENINISAFKKSEDGAGWIVRAYETARLGGPALIDAAGLGRKIEAHFGPAEIKTFYIPLDTSQAVREVNLLEEIDGLL